MVGGEFKFKSRVMRRAQREESVQVGTEGYGVVRDAAVVVAAVTVTDDGDVVGGGDGHQRGR